MPQIETTEPRVQVHQPDTLRPSDRAREHGPSPYRRDNYIADDIDESQSAATWEHPGVSKEEWVAYHILRSGGTLLCPHCLDDDRAVELADPSEHVPRTLVLEKRDGRPIIVELAVVPKRERVCPECGSVCFGGPLADRSEQEFRALVDEVCQSVAFEYFPDSRVEKARSDAFAAKGRDEGPHDVTIMEQFVAELLKE